VAADFPTTLPHLLGRHGLVYRCSTLAAGLAKSDESRSIPDSLPRSLSSRPRMYATAEHRVPCDRLILLTLCNTAEAS